MPPPKDPIKYAEHIKNLKKSHKGKPSPLRGKKQTEEHKKHNSDAHKGLKNFQSEEAKWKNREKHLGNKNYRYNGGKEAYIKRRRNLGFIPINNKFKNSEGHHLNNKYILYIPIKIHKSLKHDLNNKQSMEEINDLAIKWYFTYE